MNLKKTWPILKGTFAEFSEDKVLRLSAALAYYAMFSIGPLLVIAVGVAGLAFGKESVRAQIEAQLQSTVGPGAAKMVSSMMSAQTHGTSVTATIVGVVALLFGAGGVFGQLQDSLNTIWEVKTKPGAGIWYLIRSRFLSLTMVLGVGFLLLVSMALTTFLSALTSSMGSRLPISETLGHVLNLVISFGVITVLFAMLFKYLPDAKVPLRKMWIGAMVTSLLFTVGKFGLGMYLGRASTTSSFGAASSVIIIMMWVYYASLILFFGAEFTQVYTRQTGGEIVPAEYAERVTEEERAEEGIPRDKTNAGRRRSSSGKGRPTTLPAPSWQGSAFASTAPLASTPHELAETRPLQFVGVLFVAGAVGAALLKLRHIRQGIRLYTRLMDL